MAEIQQTGKAEIMATVFATVGGYCIDLYKNFPEPAPGGKHHELYKSYVNMAARLATHDMRTR